MKSLQQRILVAILDSTALSMVAACSNPEPKQTQPLIIKIQQPIAETHLSIHKTQQPIVETQLRMYKIQPVVIPKSKRVKHCGLELKPGVYKKSTNDSKSKCFCEILEFFFCKDAI